MEKKKVLLIGLNPNNVHGTAPYYLKAYAYTDAYIKENIDIQIQFYDVLVPQQSNGIELISRKILLSDCDIVAFSTYCWNIEEVLKIISIIKLIDSQKTIILGGPEVSGNTKEYLNNYKEIDYLIDGEGEIAFKEFLLYYLNQLEDVTLVHNLVYRNYNSIVANPIQILDDINEIPSIYSTELLNVNNIGTNLYSYETKRGCQYKCEYCFHHRGIHYIREFDVERVKMELGYILDSKLKYVWIIDPCFNENEERTIEILQYIQQNNKNDIEFGFELRNETLSEKMILELSKIKTTRFFAMGLQTLNRKSLKAISRDFDQKKFEDNMSIIKKYFPKEEQIHIDLIFGLPEASLVDYKEALDYCINLGATVFTQPLKILSGTTLFEKKNQYGYICSKIAPYEILANSTFPYEDMCKARHINVALYLFQLHPVIRKWYEHIKIQMNKKHSDIFEEVGEYMWKCGMNQFFMNYKQFPLGYVINTMKIVFKELYGYDADRDECVDFNKKVQIDWGSICNLQTYEEV